MIAGYSDHARSVTPRMLDVARCRARGLTVTQTALELGVSEATVRHVSAALCARLHVPNFHAVIWTLTRAGSL